MQKRRSRFLVDFLNAATAIARLGAILLARPQENPTIAPMPAATVEPGNAGFAKQEIALTHVREIHQFFAELRSSNFNFFLILVGAAAGAFVTSQNETIRFAAATAAAVICIVFFGLDSRAVEMIGDARRELEKLEVYFDVNLHRPDSWSTRPRRRYVTHRTLYSAIFILAYCTALAAIYSHSPF